MFEEVVEHGFDGSDVTKVKGKLNYKYKICFRYSVAACACYVNFKKDCQFKLSDGGVGVVVKPIIFTHIESIKCQFMLIKIIELICYDFYKEIEDIITCIVRCPLVYKFSSLQDKL